ncbi:hypothetical protein FB446DRAFT_648188 [Lentinula raphanica]|uniref:Clathrin/coatomer adaptor adaptin-like N-terminal domain-containing protein n=1 Tax=Lentinula raphanica TaxID=153919 RepID=A0AA38NVW0_9AGAR|nr:hypothetical protein FB446DRAFT_648188 [Lentinula raphanica]KAJ3820688.1 hypothetical protein F5880DRAFT_1487545 [Lentinula raphanica]KAJ3831596.1 hypothetical protein F5878DRAFT_549335 [Lentinula raphanica]
MWERTFQDLIRGLSGANKADESKFIAKAIEEIGQEVRRDDMELKSGAALELTCLDMMGYDICWASFHVVEVMCSPKLHLNGYVSAIQALDQDTDVSMLTTNLLKKVRFNVFSSKYCCDFTPDLARGLSPELIKMLTYPHLEIRKRVLALFKLVKRYPEVSQQVISRLQDRITVTCFAVDLALLDSHHRGMGI